MRISSDVEGSSSKNNNRSGNKKGIENNSLKLIKEISETPPSEYKIKACTENYSSPEFVKK